MKTKKGKDLLVDKGGQRCQEKKGNWNNKSCRLEPAHHVMCGLDKFGFIYGFSHENHLDLMPAKQTKIFSCSIHFLKSYSQKCFFNFFLSPWMVYLVFWMVYLVLGIMYLGFEMMYLVKKEANLMTFKWLFIWWAVSWSEKLYQSFCLKGCRSCWWYSAKLYHIFVHPPLALCLHRFPLYVSAATFTSRYCSMHAASCSSWSKLFATMNISLKKYCRFLEICFLPWISLSPLVSRMSSKSFELSMKFMKVIARNILPVVLFSN